MRSYIIFFCLFALIPLTSCKTKVTTTGTCGDNYLDPGEACDRDQVPTCQEIGYHAQSGPLPCTDSCTLDESVCSLQCGDGILSTDYEQCDGADLNGASCLSLGMGSGQLSCTTACRFDSSGCEDQAVCGDGTLSTPFEQCEGANLDGQSCQSLGYHDGALSCDLQCAFDLESCRTFGRCGDSQIQSVYGEQCEGLELSGQTCISLGFHGGTLLCGSDCLFNTEPCAAVGRCGDNTLQSSFGEVCDGTSLGGQTCISRGFRAGQLACTADCAGFDESACTNGQVGEPCLNGDECSGISEPLTANCFTNMAGTIFPDGYCTAQCTGDSPDPCVPGGGECIEVYTNMRFCIRPCVDSAECRTPDYVCDVIGNAVGTFCIPATM